MPENLVASCVLAYEELRHPACPVATPPEMAAFLYHPRFSPRALSVAHHALETNTALRRHVAGQASVTDVGYEGWYWLNDIEVLQVEREEVRASLADRCKQLRIASQQLTELESELSALSAIN